MFLKRPIKLKRGGGARSEGRERAGEVEWGERGGERDRERKQER